jgi:hypothetical protein
VNPSVPVRKNELRQKAMYFWPQGHSQKTHPDVFQLTQAAGGSLAESGECKLRGALRETSRRCSHRLRTRIVAPSLSKYPGTAARVPDKNDKAACCTPSRHRFVDFEAVRRSIRAQEDAYRAVRSYSDLLRQEVLLFLAWPRASATRPGSNPSTTQSGGR